MSTNFMRYYLISYFLFFSIFNNSKIETNITKFGKNYLNDFYLSENYTNVNHGSFGTCPIQVMKKYQKYQIDLETHPDYYIRYNIKNKLEETLILISNYINSNPKNLIFVENASDGINSILKSLFTTKGEKILTFDICFSMVKSVILYLKNIFQVENIQFKITEDLLNIPANEFDNNKFDDYLLTNLEFLIQKNLPIKAAVIDHISSSPGIILPVKKIVVLLRKYNIISIIDGAHTIGHIDLDLTDINPDFYVSCFHKWFYAPKSSSFMYVAEKFHGFVHPNIIHISYGSNNIKDEFLYTGTRDYSIYLTVKDSLDYISQIGDREIKSFCRDLAYRAGMLVKELWNTEMLTENKFLLGNMVNVRIPCDVRVCNKDFLNNVTKETLIKYNTYIMSYVFSNGKAYVRLSANIYNEISDYIFAAGKFLEVLRIKEKEILG